MLELLKIVFGGIAGLSIGGLLLWFGFGRDPFALADRRAKPSAAEQVSRKQKGPVLQDVAPQTNVELDVADPGLAELPELEKREPAGRQSDSPSLDGASEPAPLRDQIADDTDDADEAINDPIPSNEGKSEVESIHQLVSLQQIGKTIDRIDADSLTSLQRKTQLELVVGRHGSAYTLFQVNDVSGMPTNATVSGRLVPSNERHTIQFSKELDPEGSAIKLSKGEFLILLGKPLIPGRYAKIRTTHGQIGFASFPGVAPIPREKLHSRAGASGEDSEIVPDMAYVDQLIAERKKSIREYEKKLKDLKTKYLRAIRAKSRSAARIKKQMDDAQRLRGSISNQQMGFRRRLGR